jgi:uncharacterized protein (TIGR02231 family)
MKLLFVGALLSTTFCTAVWAAEFSPASKIDAVTVYPQGADVVREIAVDLPAGEHSLVLADLPQNIDAQSIRVEGDSSGALAIGSVDTRNKYVGGQAVDDTRKGLEKQMQDLQIERQNLDQTIADLNQQRTILMSLADKQLVPQSSTDTVKGIDVQQLSGLLELVGQKLSAVSKDVATAQKRQREIDDRNTQLSAQLAELAPDGDYRTEVVVNVEAAEALKGTLRISYRVNEASWVPFYDARLTIGDAAKKPTLELVQRAEVVQSTGESWTNIALTLSTARPNGTTAAPDMQAWEISRIEAVQQQQAYDAAAPAPATLAEDKMADADTENAGGLSRKLEWAKPKKVAQRQAEIAVAGFQATYGIAGRVSVDAAGQSKKVRIASRTQDATLQAVVVPRNDATAYLTAAFKVTSEGPQLPGSVNLFRDGVFVGQGALPLLNPGEDAHLGFGADDLIKVSRAEVNRVTGEEGILTSSNVEARAWDITVKNLHTLALPVRVIDRVPFTASKEIVIAEMPGMTEPTLRDLDKKRGVLAWDFTLEPNAETVLKTGYKISWPEGMQVSMVE